MTNTDASIFSLAGSLIKTSLTRAITITDNTLGSVEDASSILNRTTGVADQANNIWATKTVAIQQDELDKVLADLKSDAA